MEGKIAGLFVIISFHIFKGTECNQRNDEQYNRPPRQESQFQIRNGTESCSQILVTKTYFYLASSTLRLFVIFLTPCSLSVWPSFQVRRSSTGIAVGIQGGLSQITAHSTTVGVC